MVAEAEIICKQSIPVLDMKYHLCVAAQERNLQNEMSPQPQPPPSPVVGEVRGAELVATEVSRFESAVSFSDTIEDAAVQSSTLKFVPSIRSGSCTDIGPRDSMEDEHIRIDDLSARLGPSFKCLLPSSFYAVFDGHGGPEAAAYLKRNAMQLFFEDFDWSQITDIDDVFLNKLENSHRKAFLLADDALSEEDNVSSSCGTTALTALLLGRHLLVANAGDCRAVLCRKGVAVDLSHDHRPSYLPELRRVEDMGARVQCGYLNGLSVTRALGDWDLKLPLGPSSPLIADPEIQRLILTEDDEFLIIGCDGIWDVMKSQYAVSLVRRGLRRHDDPQLCARELVREALRLKTGDNLTVIVICFSSPSHVFESCPPQRPSRLRTCSLSEEARSRLNSLLGGN
ncbi:hypothetical protein UlMin_009170 [Ulmus minor]